MRAGLRVMKLQERIEDDWKRMQSQVSEMGILNRRNEEMSLTDELTGLSNRRHAMIAMKEAWEASETGGEDLSLIMLDIDHFKSVNDNHGHDVGDLVLKEVASRIGERSIPEFRAFRTGGEEFLVVCGGVSREDAAILAESIRQRVRARPISAVAEEIEVTVSAGVATRETGTRRVEDILRAADQAVYAAKQQGRDRAVMAG